MYLVTIILALLEGPAAGAVVGFVVRHGAGLPSQPAEGDHRAHAHAARLRVGMAQQYIVVALAARADGRSWRSPPRRAGVLRGRGVPAGDARRACVATASAWRCSPRSTTRSSRRSSTPLLRRVVEGSPTAQGGAVLDGEGFVAPARARIACGADVRCAVPPGCGSCKSLPPSSSSRRPSGTPSGSPTRTALARADLRREGPPARREHGEPRGSDHAERAGPPGRGGRPSCIEAHRRGCRDDRNGVAEQEVSAPTQAIPVAEFVRKQVQFYVRENPRKFPGVEVVETPVRSYPKGDLAAQVLGYTGLISPDQYEQLKQAGYGLNDTVGQSGRRVHLRAVPARQAGQAEAHRQLRRGSHPGPRHDSADAGRRPAAHA